MPNTQEMLYDIWKCIMTDPNTGEKYLNVRREPEPEIVIDPVEPLEPSDEPVDE